MTPGLTEELLSRRTLVARGAALAGGAVLAGPLAACGGSTPGPRKQRVVVVGAGLAGLSCAYRLHRAGLTADLYEAHPTRVGGRCWTAREFAQDQTGEHGGEFIDSDHKHIRSLAGELGLHLEDVSGRSDGHSLLDVDGRIRPARDAYHGYGRTLKQLRTIERRENRPAPTRLVGWL